jgi:hypothetical protein
MQPSLCGDRLYQPRTKKLSTSQSIVEKLVACVEKRVRGKYLPFVNDGMGRMYGPVSSP